MILKGTQFNSNTNSRGRSIRETRSIDLFVSKTKRTNKFKAENFPSMLSLRFSGPASALIASNGKLTKLSGGRLFHSSRLRCLVNLGSSVVCQSLRP